MEISVSTWNLCFDCKRAKYILSLVGSLPFMSEQFFYLQIVPSDVKDWTDCSFTGDLSFQMLAYILSSFFIDTTRICILDVYHLS